MSELLNWYVEELRQLLEAKFPPDRLDTILREAESHLRESAKNRVSGEVGEREAMIDAINAYGRPNRIAISFLRRKGDTLFGVKPLYCAIAGCLSAIFCWNFHWLTLSGYFDNFGDTWQNELAGLIGFCALAVMMLACRRGFQTYWKAVTLTTIGTALFSIPLTAFWMIGGTTDYQAISRFHLSRDSAAVKSLIGEIENYQAFLSHGMDEYKKATNTFEFKTPSGNAIFFPLAAGFSQTEISSLQVKLLPEDLRNAKLAAKELGAMPFQQAVTGATLDAGGNFIVPRQYGAFAMVRGGLDAFETVASFEDAKKAWLQNGPSIAHDLTREHADMIGLLRSADQAKAGRLFFFNPKLYSQTVIGTLFLLPFFLFLDWGAAVGAKPKRAWPKRRLA